MNVTVLPVGGAEVRVYKTVANGNVFLGNPVALTLGVNSITVSAVTFDMAVKFQFSSGDVEFDALSLNSIPATCVCNTSFVTDVLLVCDSLIWIDGNTYTSSNNSATYTLISANGCDSVVALDLTIINENAIVFAINDSTLQAQSVIVGTTYQWVDCNNNFDPITGETNATFTTQNSSYYAIELTFNGCSVISDCFTIPAVVGIDFINQNNQYRKLLKTVDLLGRETEIIKDKILYYIFDDGTIEKKTILE